MIHDIPKEMMNVAGIYAIKNILNSKVYIGSASNFQDRLYRHRYLLKKKKHFNCKLQNAVNKYGIENFTFSILETCEKNQVVNREQYWIDKAKAAVYGYNIDPCAGHLVGRYHSAETKKKLSNAGMGKVSPMKGKNHSQEANKLNSEKHKGKVISPETVQKIVATRKRNGYKVSEETKKAISNANKGKSRKLCDEVIKRRAITLRETLAKRGKIIFTQEAVDKMKVAAKKRWENPEISRKIIKTKTGVRLSDQHKKSISNAMLLSANKSKIIAFTVADEYVKEYDGISLAANLLNVKRTSIGNCLRGVSKYVNTNIGRLIFKYKNNLQ